MALAKDSTLRNGSISFEQRVITEGLPYSTQIGLTATATVNATLGSLMMPGLTRAFWMESAVLSSNKNIVVQMALSSNGIIGSSYTDFADVVLSPGGTTVIPIRQLVRPSQFGSNGGFGSGLVRNLIDADNTNAIIRITVFGHSITDDLNFGADKVLLHIGDSITAAGTGITAKTNQYDWRILGYHRDAGRSVRMVNMSMSGSTSGQADRRRAYGDYDLPQVDHINYSMGANDASSAVPTATFKANVAAAIAWKKSRYPKATMTVFGSTPHENSTNETAAIALRSAASDAVTEAADSKVKYLNLGAAFDRTVTSNFASTDTAGNRIHPSDAGHAAIWTVVQPFLAANPVLV